MNRIAGRAMITLLLVMLLLVGFIVFIYEFAVGADEWVVFPGSPHIYNGGNIGCGVVTDAEGALLLDMRNDSRAYSTNELLRRATVHWVGDRKGSINAPSLPYYSAQMSGFDLVNGVYSYAQTGGVARLSLSAKIQTAALEAMEDRKGTVGVYNYQTGELICAVTSPNFDPNNVPDLTLDTDGKYEGMYLNRFIQSVYIPGSIFKIVTLAAALEEDPSITDKMFVCTGEYQIGENEIVCEGAHWEQSLKDAFRNSCNCAFAQIALELGAETMERYVSQFRITQSIAFDGITTSAGNYDVSSASQVNFAWSAIGQYTDQVNPCRFMAFMGAIANGGKEVYPHLVNDIKVDGIRTYASHTQIGDRIMSTRTAAVLQDYLKNNVESKYGSDNFPGFTVCAKTGTGEVGGGKKPNAMFAGFLADQDYPLAFIVSIEDGGYGSSVCIPILSQILAACKEAL